MRNLQYPGRSPVSAPNAMASTSHPLSTQAAIRILQDGGNALDAAIAACAVQAVVEPASTGIGGDCFALYSPAGGDNIIAYNGSGRAPAGLSSEWLLDQGIETLTQTSPHSVTIPGAVDAWVQLNRDHGSMGMDQLLAPAIGYASDGYPITSRVSTDFANSVGKLDPDALAVFAPDGNPLPLGARHSQPALAKTLQRIAEKGRAGFYEGPVADDILAKLKAVGGRHTQEDFNAAIGDYVTPISANFRNHDIWECPPNGQGVIALMLLNIMSGIERFGDDPISVDRMHCEIEAGRLAYRDRSAVLGDPAQTDVPVDRMISTQYADKLRAMISTGKRIDPMPPSELPPHRSTVYITVIDKDRNACSFINTLYFGFGSGIMAPKSGVMLQNRGLGFVVDPAHPNGVAPNKRPLHTIIPGMVTKAGRTVMSFGVMGGEYQAFGHMQFLTRLFDYEMDIQMAQDAPRFFPDPFADFVEVEAPIPQNIRDALGDLGHTIRPAGRPIGGSQAIAIDWETGLLTAGSDPRKDGCAIGY
jgi:gamma-glutamyltranspeptidase/glutathione hydrolase